MLLARVPSQRKHCHPILLFFVWVIYLVFICFYLVISLVNHIVCKPFDAILVDRLILCQLLHTTAYISRRLELIQM